LSANFELHPARSRTVCDGCGPKKDRVTADQDAMRLWHAVLYLILGPGTLASFCAYVLATTSLGKLSALLIVSGLVGGIVFPVYGIHYIWRGPLWFTADEFKRHKDDP
jgi:hypothetical protein